MAASSTQGTVTPCGCFSAEKAATELMQAIKGLGTNEAKVIEVMENYSNGQRQDILLSFKKIFGKDLREELRSDISGNFLAVVLALLEKPSDYDAKELNYAVKGLGTDEDALIEILCSRSSSQIQEIKRAYKTLFKTDLDKDIMDDTSGDLASLLAALLSTNREEPLKVDQTKADADAKELYEAGEGKLGTDESTFNRILTLRSYPQLVATFDAYWANHDKDIEQAIKDETSGYYQDGLLAIVAIARNTPAYFADRIYRSMKGVGTNDRMLIRCVVSRSEVDMVQIKKEFQRLYEKSLGSFIKEDTSGDYKNILLALCKEA